MAYISYSFSRVRALVSNPKMVSAHYLVKEFMDLDHILHISTIDNNT